MSDRPPPTNDDGRVVRFRPRGPARGWGWPLRGFQHGDESIGDLAKFERTDSEDDYRHRMKMNALALVVTIVLVIAGVWLVSKLAQMRTDQDCYLSGRRNCTPINAPPIERS